ncbi:hypothetical protein [Sphingobacterium bovistauri]|uniref:Immunity protein 50 n=1 Tax=Sphingobacterium bovistauri TaxID=2781959 RepID=A0ABS7Z505_9SPHI|nr:hypothetical protein [Sphingobacterium bovistauri]MCA5005224.1 hypothetical protein [Sphingobacterium bovistauri]
MNNLTYNYHDAILETVVLQQNDLVLTIALYPVFYPNHQQIKLKIIGISNVITCQKWIAEVKLVFQEEHEATLGARINEIYLDKNNKNQLLIAIDSTKTVKLNFENLQEILNPTICS